MVWFDSVTGDSPLEQGDMFFQFPVVIPSLTKEHIDQIQQSSGESTPRIEGAADVKNVDVIVMTQSCDLQNDKTDSVILCPVWDVDSLGWGRAKKEDARKGRLVSTHLLNKAPELGLDFKAVEFSRLYMSSKDTLERFAELAGPRIRLVSPYKEHLSQAFARFFMRVGLPSDIPPF